MYEDFVFYWEYTLFSENAFFMEKYFYNYIRRNDSIMSNTLNGKSEKVIDHLLCTKIIYDYLKRHNLFEIKKNLFNSIFKHCFKFTYCFSPDKCKMNVLRIATSLVLEMELDQIYNDDDFIINLKNERYNKIDAARNCTFLQRIFSLLNDENHKIVRILGLEFRLERKQKELSNISRIIIADEDEHELEIPQKA